MTDIFADFRRLVLAALDELAAKGGLPRGLDSSRVAVELPRDPAHGDLSTNAAMGKRADVHALVKSQRPADASAF